MTQVRSGLFCDRSKIGAMNLMGYRFNTSKAWRHLRAQALHRDSLAARRRALGRERTARWRARQRTGIRTLRVHIPLAAGIIVTAVDVVDAEAEAALLDARLITSTTDDQGVIDAAVVVLVRDLLRRDASPGGRPRVRYGEIMRTSGVVNFMPAPTLDCSR
jgi:hypothetical protein